MAVSTSSEREKLQEGNGLGKDLVLFLKSVVLGDEKEDSLR